MRYITGCVCVCVCGCQGDERAEGRRGQQPVGAGGEGGLLPAHVGAEQRVPRGAGHDPADGERPVSEGRDLYHVAQEGTRTKVQLIFKSYFSFFGSKHYVYVCVFLVK